MEKAEAYDSFFKTASTFTLHGYVPREECDFVRAAIDAVTPAAVTEFTEPTEEDTPPTLLKNRGPAKSAEFVTNMYSAPDYREYDPNGVGGYRLRYFTLCGRVIAVCEAENRQRF